jgi:3-deoxy-7-phosphoheptulonate synthase/chorismate mutase
MLEINKLRGDIDIIDSEIINLLSKRGKLVLDIAQYKKEHNLQITDSNREKEHLEFLKKLNTGVYLDAEIEAIFKMIFIASKGLQVDDGVGEY